jgi:peptide/nickel transport system permease protein
MASGMRRFLHEPGGYRIVAGTVLVTLLMAATLGGHWLTPFSPDEMDLDAQMQPPEMGWLAELLTSSEGRVLLEARKDGVIPKPSTDPGAMSDEGFGNNEDEEDLGFLRQDSGSAKVGSSSGRDAAGNSNKTPLLSRHWLGTDKDGRDIFALLIAGARTSLLPGLLACAVALGLGVPLGLLAGYYGGRMRRLLQSVSGTILSMPRLVLILVVVCALEPNVYYTMVVLGLTLVPRVSELLMTRVRLLANQGFILAAKEGGLSDWRILSRHLFWYQNRQVFTIQFSLIMAESILTETTLSYLQFGTKPPEVSWGNIIEGSQMTFFSGFYWITFFPAMAIIMAILGFFYVGDGLNARLAFKEGR